MGVDMVGRLTERVTLATFGLTLPLDVVVAVGRNAIKLCLQELRGRSLGWLEGALAGGAANA